MVLVELDRALGILAEHAVDDTDVEMEDSGGPMLNLQGQVIGVVSAKRVGLNIEGVGFAISANTVKLYLDRLLDGEIIAR